MVHEPSSGERPVGTLMEPRASLVMGPRLNIPPTAIECAFQLARTGHYRTVEEIKRVIRREGYSAGQIEVPALMKQLRQAINTARSAI